MYYGSLDGDPNWIKNEPLLGFSLVNIAFDNENEFLIRIVHNNFIDPDPCEPDYSRIHIERVTEGPDPAGMMRMCNWQDLDPCSPTYGELFNARAKGLFSKSSEKRILIWFEYLFETSDPDVELVIYLTDVPELLAHGDPGRAEHYLEVARLRAPLGHQPGSAGSGRFGRFKKYVSTGNLNFIRGTRIEFELIGPDGTCILINNWDPQVHCSGTYCKDVTGDKGVTIIDFLTVIGEYGETAELTQSNSRACLEGIFSDDGYVDSDDISGWDWTLNSEDRKNLCNTHIPLTDDPPNKAGCPSCPPAKSTNSPPMPSVGPVNLEGFDGAFLVAGKMYSALEFLTDRLYGYDELGGFINQFEPVFDRTNGRLVTDSADVLYQLNLEQGLVRLADAQPIVPTGQDAVVEPRYGLAADVYVGLQGTTGNWWGRPIADAAFDADGFVYVTPIVVAPVGQDPNLAYTAAAKLQLTGGSPPYDVVQIYDDPDAFNPNDNRELNHLREIEVDDNGYVYVANAHSTNESDILWVYDADTGQMEKRLTFSNDPNSNSYLPAPIGMHVSNTTGMLYLASSQNSAGSDSTSVYGISIEDLFQSQKNPDIETIEIQGMGHITDMTHDPATGTLWVVGFRMEDIPDKPTATDSAFYEPYIARIPFGSTGPVDANCLSDSVPGPENDLALPLSIVWTGLETETLDVSLGLDKSWMYQSLPGQSNSNLTADVLITYDPMGNSSYTYDWEFILPDDVTVAPAITAGGGFSDPCCTFAAPSCNEPDGLSDSGETFTIRVTVTGEEHGNTGIAEAEFGVALLGDVNNDGVVNFTDRSIINAFWRLGAAGPFTFNDCNVNDDTAVNIADRSIANAVWRGVLCQNSVGSPCPLR